MYLFNLSVGLALLAGYPAQSISVTDENDGTPYGVDCSFPIQNKVRKTRKTEPHRNHLISFLIIPAFL
jgi:hypothetical protein